MEKQILKDSEKGENIAEVIKGCLLVSGGISLLLYFGFRIIFNDFETTISDELLLFGRIVLGSVAVVMLTALVITVIKMAGQFIQRTARERQIWRMGKDASREIAG